MCNKKAEPIAIIREFILLEKTKLAIGICELHFKFL